MHTTSLTLLERLRQPSDAEAWRRLVHLYSPLLMAWGSRCGLQASDAADLTQDVFAVLLEKLPTFAYQSGGSFRAWLKTITMNRLRDLQRRKSLRLTVALDGQDVARDDPLVDFWEREYQQVLMRNALDLIRGEFSSGVWVQGTDFLFSGDPADAVAKRHGVSENAIYIAKCRVQRRLKEVLAGLMD